MNGITHKQAQRYIQADLDRLLTPSQRLDLEAHLRACEACRADSESLSALTARLQNEFHSRWDTQAGPSEKVMANVQSQSRSIQMQKRIDFAFNIFGGIVTLLVLFFVVTALISQFQKKSTTANITQTNIPAYSSEERLIAFTSAVNDNLDIFTMRADGSQLTNLTNNPASDTNPVWSPDGKRIAFMSNRNDANSSQIYLMDADGSKVTLLTKERVDHILPVVLNNKSSLWSPDGSKLLYLQYRYDTDWNLQSIDVNNGNTIYLGTGRFDLNNISWSPDGRYIAYLKNDPQNTDENSYLPDLHVVNADGGNSREIKKLIPADERLFDYRWSKDGDSIIFMGYKDNPFSIETIYEFNLNTNSLIQNFTLTTGAIDWHDGISLIRPSAKETTFIWQRPDGTSNSLQWGAACSEFNFGRSSSGNFIIGAVCPDQKSGFYWANSDGSIIKNLLTIGDMARVPGWIDWSPDDQYLATTVVTLQNTSLYILNVEESLKNPSLQPVVVSVADEESFIPIAWQPMISEDRTEAEPTPEAEKTSSYDDLIAFTAVNNDATNTNTDIYTIRVDGSDIKNLTHDPAKDFNANDDAPVWSPDRRKIAFMSDRDSSTTGNTNIFVMNPDGSGLAQLTHNPGYDALLSWSPSGEQIVYFSSPTAESNAQGQLIVMNADGSNKIVITPPGYYYFQSWSPDNQKIIYVEPGFDGPSYQDAGIHFVDLEGKNGPEWFVDNIDLIHWEDTEHFLGVVRNQAKWSLYRFGMDGSQVELASQSGQIVSIFESTYAVESQDGLMWYSLEDPSATLNTWKPAEKCEAKGGLYHSTGLTQSPDQKHALAIIYCIEATWYFLVNEDGSEVEQLGAPMDGSMGVLPQWSPDGKYISLFFLNKKGVHGEHLSLIDIERMRNDPAASPIPLTTNTVIGFGMSEPLIVSNEAEEKPTPKPHNFSLTVYEAEKLAFFDVLEPSHLPAGYTLEGVAYDPWAQKVAMKYSSQQGTSSIFIYQQRGDLLQHPDLRAYAIPVSIGDTSGEFIQGAWIYESPNTTTPTWDPRAEAYGLSWQNGEFVFSIDFIGGEGITPLPLTEFVAIAEGLK